MKPTRTLRLVVVCPSDVEAERQIVDRVAENINQNIARHFDLRLDTDNWKKSVPPGFHKGGPQAQIDSYLGIQDADFVIGIFGARFGSVLETGETGTEYEIRQAHKIWQAKGEPRILVYFKTIELNSLGDDARREYLQLKEFQKWVSSRRLWAGYTTAEDFTHILYGHLLQYLNGIISPAATSSEQPIVWSASAVPVSARAEGIAELVGDITLAFTFPPDTRYARCALDITVLFNVNVTSRIFADDSLSAVLTLESPRDKGSRRFAFMAAQYLSPNGLFFRDVYVDESTRVRVSNVRVNAGQIDSTLTIGYVSAFIVVQARDKTGRPKIPSESVVDVAHIQPCFTSLIQAADTDKQCPIQLSCEEGLNREFLAEPRRNPAVVSFIARFNSRNLSSLKTRAQEAGFAPHRTSREKTSAQLSEYGLRFLLWLDCIPRAVRIWVTTSEIPVPRSGGQCDGNPPWAVLVESDRTGRGALDLSARVIPDRNVETTLGFPLSELVVIENSCWATWEWVCETNADSTHGVEICFGIVVAFEAGAAHPGTAYASTALAPLSTVTLASHDAPVPRFYCAFDSLRLFTIGLQ